MNNMELSLNDLAVVINNEHALCGEAIRQGLEHAIKAGEYLTRAKEQFNHGEWLPWLAENVNFSERTAQNYMRVYNRRDELQAKAQHVADLTYRDALSLLAEPQSALTETRMRLFQEVGEALLEIRDNRLYRKDYATFENYCRDKLGIGPHIVQQLIELIEAA